MHIVITDLSDGSSLNDSSAGSQVVVTDEDGHVIGQSSSSLGGTVGPAGAQGFQGNQGFTGSSLAGPIGAQGHQGNTGADSTVVGPTGAQGFQGNQGHQGNQGQSGVQGHQGNTGAGDVGPAGAQGLQGHQGEQGVEGATGSTGAQGNIGADSTVAGPVGARGDFGGDSQLFQFNNVVEPVNPGNGKLKYNFAFKGGWVIGTTYSQYDVVDYEGGTYISKGGSNQGNAPVNATFWDPFTTAMICVDNVEFNSTDVRDWLDSFDDNTTNSARARIRIFEEQNSSVFATFKITSANAINSLTGVSAEESNNIWEKTNHYLSNGDAVGFASMTSGATASGTAIGSIYYVGQVGAGIYASNFKLYLDSALNTELDVTVDIVGAVLETYRELNVSYVDHNGAFDDNDSVVLSFSFAGDKGDVGAQGNQGDIGTQGSEGNQGHQGDDGADSTVAGPTGAQGHQGDDGTDSTVAGPTGAQGSQGHQGNTGADSTVVGPAGAQGHQGDTGADSTVAGPAGAQGHQGHQGNAGADGSDGSDGAAGAAGAQGHQGHQGDDGSDGAAGAAGADGATWTSGTSIPSSGSGNDGDFFFKTDDDKVYKKIDSVSGWVLQADLTGSTGNTGQTGFTGAQGHQGDQGVAGAAGNQGHQGTDGSPGPEVVFKATHGSTTYDLSDNTSNCYTHECPLWNKADFDQEEFDTASNYSTSTNRFTPTTAGKYKLHAIVGAGVIYNTDAGAGKLFEIRIIKNETGTTSGTTTAPSGTIVGQHVFAEAGNNIDNQDIEVDCIADANGSSDHFEVWFKISNIDYSNATNVSLNSTSCFDGFLINQGAQGTQGNQGNAGAAGGAGSAGAQGSQGHQGASGGGGGGGNLTTKGDLEVFKTSQTRLGVGTDGYVLTADSLESAGVAWRAAGSGSQGHQGDDGADGSDGNDGSAGAQGAQGHQGDDGADGSDGNDGSAGAQGAQGHQGTVGAAGSTSSAIRLALASNQTNLTSSYGGVEFSTTPLDTFGGIWTVSAGGGTVGTYITTSVAINAFVSFGVTIDKGSLSNGMVLMKVQKDNGSLVWADVPGSIIVCASPSATPAFYNTGGSCMVDMAAGESLRLVALDDTNGNLDLNAGTDGDTYVSVKDMIGGEVGAQGAQGAAGGGGGGSQGAQGNQGDAGNDGAAGAQGNQGDDGADGSDGNDGSAGAQGAQGHQGDDGADGSDGNDGSAGAQGAQGHQGDDGADGSDGNDGSDGAQGAQGHQGDTGADSTVAGPAGAQGHQGDDGAAGSAGAQGHQGDTGSGSQGSQGHQGAAGSGGGSTAIRDPFIFLANGNAGISSFGLDENGDLTLKDTQDDGGTAKGIWSDGTYVFLANMTDGVRTYSVNSSGVLASESQSFSTDVEGVWGMKNSTDCCGYANMLFVAHGSSGLKACSYDDDGALTALDTLDIGGYCYKVHGTSRYPSNYPVIFAANGSAGVTSYHWESATSLAEKDTVIPGGGTTYTVDTSSTVTFTKANNAGNTGSAVDELTDSVHFARNDDGYPIFNAVTETGSDSGSNGGPDDTEWAVGSVSQGVGNLTFDTLSNTLDNSIGTNILDSSYNPMVVHLITDDLYLDIEFTVWQGSGAGGGFSYERSVINTVSGGDVTYDVHTDDQYLYVAAGTEGLYVYRWDDSDGSLTEVDNDDQGGTAMGVWGDGNRNVFVADGSGGIRSYTMSGDKDNTGHPEISAINDTETQTGDATNVHGDGRFIVVSTSGDGLYTYSTDSAGLLTEEDNYDFNDAEATAYDVYCEQFRAVLDLGDHGSPSGLKRYEVDGDDNGGNGWIQVGMAADDYYFIYAGDVADASTDYELTYRLPLARDAGVGRTYYFLITTQDENSAYANMYIIRQENDLIINGLDTVGSHGMYNYNYGRMIALRSDGVSKWLPVAMLDNGDWNFTY